MIVHMFAFRWKTIATLADKERAIAQILSFRGAIPGMLEVHVGANISVRGQGWETGGIMKFTDLEALSAYNSHELHRTLLDWLLPLIEPIEVDFYSLG